MHELVAEGGKKSQKNRTLSRRSSFDESPQGLQWLATK